MSTIDKATIEQAHAEVIEESALLEARNLLTKLKLDLASDYGVWSCLHHAELYVMDRQKEVFAQRFSEVQR